VPVNLREAVKLLRTRWITVCVTALITFLGAAVYTLLQTPLYQASTRLFVSTTSGNTSANDLYQGSRYSQDRVFSYTQLVMGETLAQRTIDRLQLDKNATALQSKVTARSKPGSVLIDVSVLDESPVQARDIANALSDEFVLMARELETPGAGVRPDARVIVEQRASVPARPISPNVKLNLAAGLALGGLLGFALALLRHQLDNTVKDRETLERLSGTAVVGVIPFDKLRRESPSIVFDNDNSPSAEAFRKFRTNLQFLAVDNPPRLIVVTSSVPSEGKSTTAINTALSLAEADHNVLLVDGDMRRPTIDKYLDLVGAVGFSSVLSGRASLDEALQKTQFPRLTVLTAGNTPPNPSELLGSLTAKSILRDLREKFDYIIVDSPPLLAVTDGAILAAQSDGVFILVRAAKTKREQLTHSVGILNDVGATLLGTVLTMTSGQGNDYYSYDYYYGGTVVPAEVRTSEQSRPNGTLSPGASASSFAQWTARRGTRRGAGAPLRPEREK